MKVRALRTVYVDLKLRKEGAEFQLENEKDFSPRSMELLDAVKKTGKKKSKMTDDETGEARAESVA